MLQFSLTFDFSCLFIKLFKNIVKFVYRRRIAKIFESLIIINITGINTGAILYAGNVAKYEWI